MNSYELYEQLKAAGVPLASHASDLYAKVTTESRQILKQYQFRRSVTMFTNNVDGLPWYDIPFAYQPFWEAVARRAKLKGEIK